MEQALSGIVCCVTYIDDILVFGESREEHDSTLSDVLARLHHHNFHLNLSKCEFNCQCISFLGNMFSYGCMQVDPQRLQGVCDMPNLTNTKQLQSFLGAVNYYTEFLKDAASLTSPLQCLLCQGTPWIWGEQQQQAMNTIHQRLGDLPTLFTFLPNCQTIVTTDASGNGLGATLSQVQNGHEVPITYASHTLKPAECNYAMNECEALAIVWALKHWESYLLGIKFLLRCDHKPLGSLLQHTNQRKRAKFIRWSDRLSRFQYTFQYISGSDNNIADCLSRLPSASPAIADSGINAHSVQICRVTEGISMIDILQAIRTDPIYAKLLHAIHTNEWKNTVLHDFYNARAALDTKSERGQLYAVMNDRIVVPTTLRYRILQLAHRGHPGIVRMKQKLRSSYWWPAMDAAAENHVRHCIGCQASSKSADKADTSANQGVSIPDTTWTKLALDITGPFIDAPHSQRYIVAAIDYTSKYAAIHSCNTITSASILRWLDELFCDFGLPSQIVTDNGRQFTSDLFTQYLAERDIEHIRATPYCPQSNGLVERFNRILKSGIQAFTREGVSWTVGLRQLLINYRGTAHGADNASPAARLFSRHYRQPHQVVERTTTTQADYHTSGTTRGSLKRGTEVLLRDMRPTRGKGQPTWLPEPYTVQKRNNKTYTVVRSDGTPNSQLKRHRRDIKRFFRPDNFATPRVVFFNMQPTKQPPSTAQPSSPRQIRQRNAPNRLGNTVDSGQLRFRIMHQRKCVNSILGDFVLN